MKLSLGAGYSHEPGWTTLDINPATKPDIVGPVFPLDLPDASVDEMRAVDVLEHISYRDTFAVLHEWARVARTGARLYVQVPDAEEAIRRYHANKPEFLARVPEDALSGLPGPWPMRALEWVLLGGHADGQVVHEGDDWRWNAHYALFSRGSLSGMLYDAGWDVEEMVTNDHPNLCTTARKR